MKQHQWIEVWIDSASKGDFVYVLLVRALASGGLEIIDPQKEGQVIATFQKYEEASHWLIDDEYELVEGRRPVE